jgi:hypothetical protein
MKHLHLEAPLPAGLRSGQGGQQRVRDAVHHAAPVHIFIQLVDTSPRSLPVQSKCSDWKVSLEYLNGTVGTLRTTAS